VGAAAPLANTLDPPMILVMYALNILNMQRVLVCFQVLKQQSKGCKVLTNVQILYSLRGRAGPEFSGTRGATVFEGPEVYILRYKVFQ
jgi:hypothetical protein